MLNEDEELSLAEEILDRAGRLPYRMFPWRQRDAILMLRAGNQMCALREAIERMKVKEPDDAE